MTAVNGIGWDSRPMRAPRWAWRKSLIHATWCRAGSFQRRIPSSREATTEQMEQRLLAAVNPINGGSLTARAERSSFQYPPIAFDRGCIDSVRHAAQAQRAIAIAT
ncbi:hypothetical protein J4732_16425 [Serratia marcescens]|uniref:Uncharacterized protein n=1 Tax=Serratia marcescens TaxID=615 RepID=A0A939NKD7_SERMA|nr:hypothetical protein [Serratia marcescens]